MEVSSIEEKQGIKIGINTGFLEWKMERSKIFQFQYALVNEERDQDGKNNCYRKNR